MKDFSSFKDVKLTSELISKIKKHFAWAVFNEGQANISVTPSGGIHYTGIKKLTPCISFEIRRGGIYFMITMFEYPKGIIMHLHVYLSDIEKTNMIQITSKRLYEEIKNILY